MPIELAAFTDIEAVATDAAGALDRARQPSLFDRLDWYRLVVGHCPPEGSPLIVRARDGANAAWLFLSRQGQKAAALANWYSLKTGMVSSGRPVPALVEAIGDYLRTNLHLASIELAPLPPDQADILELPFRNAGWIGRRSTVASNWQVRTAAMDWRHFLQARPSQLQNTIRRKEGASDLEIRIISEFDAFAWQCYEDVYKESWKPTEGSPAFLRALAEAEGKAGTLRLGLALASGKPVAAQFWLVENGEATIHKLAHRESCRAKSPGTVLSAAMFRYVIDVDKVQLIDFGTGNEPYKAQWMDQVRPLYRLRLHNPATLQGGVGALRDTLSAARAKVRRARQTGRKMS